jgi:hypothetical protein
LAWGGGGLDSTGSGQGPVAGCCECGDEPSGSCATELLSYLVEWGEYVPWHGISKAVKRITEEQAYGRKCLYRMFHLKLQQYFNLS